MPSKTKEPLSLQEKIDDARAEHAHTQQRIAELSEELGQIPARLQAVDWSNEDVALGEVAEYERKRDGLPHLIRHLRREEARQEIALLHLEVEAAEEKRSPLNERVEERQAEFERARQALNEARGEWQDLVYGTLSDLRRSISAAEKRLAAVDQEIPVEAAPPVRSVWQMQKTSPEDHLQDPPANMHFGSASVSDTPLFAGDAAPQPTPVIPEKALRGNKQRQRGGE